jgi:hypothetical protein
MRRAIWQVIIGLSFAFGMSGMASAGTFNCTPGSFLSLLTVSNDQTVEASGQTFGEICVTLVDSNTASIQAEALNGWSFVDGNSLALNFNGTDTCPGPNTAGACVNGAVTSNAGGPYAQAFPATDNVDGYGSFNFHISEQNSSPPNATLLTFTVDTSGTPWTTASDVLIFNGPGGFDAAAHIQVAGSNCGTPTAPSLCTFFAGENTQGTIIQENPEPGVLSLLAIGLLGLGATGLRGRRKA